jgi:hypothetical protein
VALSCSRRGRSPPPRQWRPRIAGVSAPRGAAPCDGSAGGLRGAQEVGLTSKMIVQSRHSAFTVLTRRSAQAFAFGERSGVLMASMSWESKHLVEGRSDQVEKIAEASRRVQKHRNHLHPVWLGFALSGCNRPAADVQRRDRPSRYVRVTVKFVGGLSRAPCAAPCMCASVTPRPRWTFAQSRRCRCGGAVYSGRQPWRPPYSARTQ